MKKFIASLAAAGVLVVGAFVATTITSTEASAQTAQTEDSTQVTRDGGRPQPGSVLGNVLDELVEDETLTQAQADAVKAAMADKREEFKEKRGERREQREQRRAQIEEWLSDGVISADELAELSADSRLLADDGPLAEALEDGQITQEEWDAFIAERKERHDARRGAPEDSATS